jgi:hypothetical protein
MRFTMTFSIKQTAFVSSLALIAACGGTGNNPVDDEAFGRISGFVTDLTGAPVADVEVNIHGLLAETDDDGFYVVDGVDPSESILVEFTKRGFAKGYATTAIISWETVGVNGTMLAIDGSQIISAAQGGLVEVGEVSVDFGANAIIDADGALYSGDVTVEVTHLDPQTEMDAAPGDLTALGWNFGGIAKDALSEGQLVSYGMVDVSLFGEDGEPLNIDEDSPVAIEMPISNGNLGEIYAMASGDEQQTWSFDPERHSWVEESVGVVSENEEGELTFNFEATHFSWWNCDQGMVPSCASGRVVDMLGYAVRGATVTCAGQSSTSTVTTDEDGYYVCSILVGDTVDFQGKTFVSDRWWGDHQGSFFMDGEGSSAATCEPIPTITIDVCRETGAVTVQNIHSVTEEDVVAVEGDTIGAFFWEPPGDPEFCQNPWDNIPMDSCEVFDIDDIASHFPNLSNSGIPEDSRSVGSYVEVSTPRHSYTIDRTNQAGESTYLWQTHSENSDGSVNTVRPDFRGGDWLDISTPGDSSDYNGAWDEAYFAEIPSQVELRDNSFLDHTSGSLNISYDGAENNSNGLIVLGAAADMDGGEALICKMNDDGQVNIPSNDMNDFDSGWMGLGLYHANTNWGIGPDGLPIRIQIFSGADVPVLVQ